MVLKYEDADFVLSAALKVRTMIPLQARFLLQALVGCLCLVGFLTASLAVVSGGRRPACVAGTSVSLNQETTVLMLWSCDRENAPWL